MHSLHFPSILWWKVVGYDTQGYGIAVIVVFRGIFVIVGFLQQF